MSDTVKQAVLHAEEAIRELAQHASDARDSGRALAEAKRALDASRSEIADVLSGLRELEARFLETAATNEGLLRTAAAGMQLRMDEIQARLIVQAAHHERTMSVHAEALQKQFTSAAADVVASARRALQEGATVVRDAEASFNGGAHLLRTYADAFRTSWVAEAKATLASVAAQSKEAVRESQEVIVGLTRSTEPIVAGFQRAGTSAAAAATDITSATKVLAESARTSNAAVTQLTETTPPLFNALSRANDSVVTASATMAAASRTMLAKAGDPAVLKTLQRVRATQVAVATILVIQLLVMAGTAALLLQRSTPAAAPDRPSVSRPISRASPIVVRPGSKK
jgi:uncharacterized phage infection (PIP) family protein YhgE